MKESSNVLITSLVPALTFSTPAIPPHTAPAITAASYRQHERQPQAAGHADMAVKSKGRRGDPADCDLPFASHIGEVGALGEHKAEPDQREDVLRSIEAATA